ncbi:uncharacterized protein LOC116990112 [Amblyraja radiata]|uniref:uncharacterized protein LOC116990112 n=1 Tax=Amblyraja radiata TaxID=386614 RepID=UPI00140414A5|nr:uncharacterized protein LOC116990112 [Amblyraja radiata]
MEQQQKESISGVQEESHNLQSQITSQFAELHQIFTEKEQRFLGDIQEEEKKIVKRMKKNLQEIQENLNSIQEELSKLQEQMDQKADVIFLKDEAGRESSASVDTESLSVTDAAPAFETIYRPFVLSTMITEISDAIKRCSFSPYVANAAAGKIHFHTGSWRWEIPEHNRQAHPSPVSPPLKKTGARPLMSALVQYDQGDSTTSLPPL